MEQLDLSWLCRFPVPELPRGTNKNERGRVLIVGGGAFVPGALQLAGEAALRVGAGKLRLATIEAAATGLGLRMPEAALFALPADDSGELGEAAADVLAPATARCDALVIGPGMVDEDRCTALLLRLLDRPRDPLTLLLDAACIPALPKLHKLLALHEDRVVVTPHFGEMARLIDVHEEDVHADPVAIAARVAGDLGATVALKSDRTIIASPDGSLCAYAGDCPGLATSGSGDVLAGVIGGLLARGTPPHAAACWGVWLHGEAGRLLTTRHGKAGFLARELAAEIPRLIETVETSQSDEAHSLHDRTL